jgi:hypothetical protein
MKSVIAFIGHIFLSEFTSPSNLGIAGLKLGPDTVVVTQGFFVVVRHSRIELSHGSFLPYPFHYPLTIQRFHSA